MTAKKETDMPAAAGKESLDASEAEKAIARAEAQEYALQVVFDDIRDQSRRSNLVQPHRWAQQAYTPDHMDDAEFADLVFEILARSKQAESQDVASTDTCAYVADPDSPSDGTDAPSTQGGSTRIPCCSDIVVLEGTKSRYLYSRTYMTDAYANWSYLALEDNTVVTLVQCAREESRIYPRPMLAASLKNDPFNLTETGIADAWQAITASDSYPDMRTCSASNGDEYFYSIDYLSTVQAKALAEWYSVERPMAL